MTNLYFLTRKKTRKYLSISTEFSGLLVLVPSTFAHSKSVLNFNHFWCIVLIYCESIVIRDDSTEARICKPRSLPFRWGRICACTLSKFLVSLSRWPVPCSWVADASDCLFASSPAWGHTVCLWDTLGIKATWCCALELLFWQKYFLFFNIKFSK